MKITRITAWACELPLKEPYCLSGGRLKFEKLDSTYVRLQTDEGLVGWGEACPWGHTYLPAYGAGVRAGLEILAPAVMGHDPCAVQAINQRMDVVLPGHPYAKAALDVACWDILGQFSGLPLWRLFGVEQPAVVALNSSISTATPEQMISAIRHASAAGYRTHSAKVGGTDSAADIARIEAIAAALPAEESVTYDVNRAWTPGLAMQVMNSVSTRDWFEQPCETLEQCAHVAQRVVQPIVLDECLHTYQDHLQAWRLRACEGVKIKPNRLGGLSKAKWLVEFGVSVGWRMHVEDVGGSALADTAAMHLAATVPDEHRLASWICHPHLSLDPVMGQGVRNVAGSVTPPSVPGLGVVPDPTQLGEPTVDFC